MRLSITIPIYSMLNDDFFLKRCLKSLGEQTFQDFELVITTDGKMAENTNSAIKRSTGDYIKILYMDDYLAHKNALQAIVDALEGNPVQWLVTGCSHDPGGQKHLPTWNDEIQFGNNTIGSPSVLTIKNDNPLLFDENLNWLLDCDYYKRMYDKFGVPVFLPDINVVIGVGDHQATNLMSHETKQKDYEQIHEKYSRS